jgi:hypothetical protein
MMNYVLFAMSCCCIEKDDKKEPEEKRKMRAHFHLDRIALSSLPFLVCSVKAEKKNDDDNN